MQRTITISCLGNMGRFGNQMFQYAFARKYAEMHDATLQTPDWIGNCIFKEAYEAPIGYSLPQTESDRVPWGKVNVDLYGFFQHQKFVEHLRRSELKKWFSICDDILANYKRPDGFYIAAHLRKGDYISLKHVYCNIHEQCYIDACREHGLDESKLIFVREDSPRRNPALEEMGFGFLEDFLTIMNADVILRANSTFSWWAATLSNAKIYSPVVEDKIGEHNDIKFVEGNWPRSADSKRCGGVLSDLHLQE